MIPKLKDLNYAMWLNICSFSLYCADCPNPPNPLYVQTVQNRLVNSQFMCLSFTVTCSFFYINQPAQTADLSSMSFRRKQPFC